MGPFIIERGPRPFAASRLARGQLGQKKTLENEPY